MALPLERLLNSQENENPTISTGDVPQTTMEASQWRPESQLNSNDLAEENRVSQLLDGQVDINMDSQDGKLPAKNEDVLLTAHSSSLAPITEGGDSNADDEDEDEDDNTDDDGDEDEDDENDGDDESELSDGDDLQGDLEEALDDSNFSFSGTFYHAGIISAPNPCLYISGLGLVGLPLSDRDARSLISCATLAPFGHGERTVVDKEVRDTWEIDPSRISFANTQWAKYIQETACAEVCKSLGVNTSNTRLHMELYKLLLYEKGSHFLSHQDTQKSNGMFATVIIILPSAYTGGQVVLSHSSTQKTIDFAKDSLLSTALLAWYTDVKHEVKEVTSGYRLALSYNLIHVASPGAPPPAMPDMRCSVSMLRRVLRKWRDGMYNGPSNGVLAYLLKHEYSSFNLKDGIKALKGTDSHRVSFIRSTAEELGFMVGIAALSHHVTGPADDCGGGYRGGGFRGRHRYRYDYYDDEEDEGTPDMLEVDSTTTSIEGIVDLDGISLLPFGNIDLDDDCLIPKDAFEDQTSDDTEYEGYMGNGAGQVEHWYRRTALVLIHESDVDTICYQTGGVDYAHGRLKRSTAIPPTDDDKLWASRLLQNTSSLNKTHVVTLMEYALKWKDVLIWKGVMKCPSCTLKNIESSLFLNAWKAFSFDQVRLSFEELLARSIDLRDQITFIYSLPTQAIDNDRQAVHAWCQKESDKVLASYSSVNPQDIPTIMYIIHTAGLEAFSRKMIPNLLGRPNAYTFLLALRKALLDGSQSILVRQARPHFAATPTTEDSGNHVAVAASVGADAGSTIKTNPALNPTASLLNKLTKECLEVAALQWSNAGDLHRLPPSHPNYRYVFAGTTPTQSKVDRIIEIVEHASTSNSMDVVKNLFVNVLKVPGDFATKFKNIYAPLIPRLKASLDQRNLSLYTPPFIDLLQIIIGSYLREILGKKGQMHNANLRKIGCGCADCFPLDKFMLDTTATTTVFRLVQKRRMHLEQRAAAAADLCTFTTIRTGSPHGVQVTKRPEVVVASQWGLRQQNAQKFLMSVGSDADIARIMGSRYADVGLALKGVQQFGAAPVEPPATTTRGTHIIPTIHAGPSRTAPVQPTASSSSTFLPVATAAPPRLAGTKRKNGPTVQLGPVIDLTGDESS